MILYVIGPMTGPVKIGISGAALVRLKQLQIGHPRRLLVLAEAPGGEAEEQAAHTFLAPWKLEGEWFDRSEEVERFIECLTAKMPVRAALSRLAERREMRAKLKIKKGRKKKLPMRLATVCGESVENGV